MEIGTEKEARKAPAEACEEPSGPKEVRCDQMIRRWHRRIDANELARRSAAAAMVRMGFSAVVVSRVLPLEPALANRRRENE